MPVRGPPPLEKPYFTSLAELDAWADAGAAVHDAVPRYAARPATTGPRLLVCHDFKGGYAEESEAMGYTFNFWAYTDVFVYFSHHRVTPPPPGWTTAAHRAGSKILGTLIFEHAASEPDGLRLLFGRLPFSRTGPAAPSPTINPNAVPVSPHYATLLARLAAARGFDGWLLNFEFDLRADEGAGHARALAAWVGLLTAEMKRLVGEHAEVVWYDSVVVTGQVRWQDRLNAYNLPFFAPSTGFFTNYTWPSSYPSEQASYISSLPATALSLPPAPPKSTREVYVGIDVYGRGSHGGGGFGAFRALEHIVPAGLSVALFAPGWTWEAAQDRDGFDWDSWWARERALWVGPAYSNLIELPPPPKTGRRPEDPECPHGEFRLLSEFFARAPPPPVDARPFCTSFCPGAGKGWFVSGARVSDAAWTDVGRQSPLGDLLWPAPALAWQDRETDEAPPLAQPPELDWEGAWAGGSALKLALEFGGSAADDAVFRCAWLPVQTAALAPGGRYAAALVYQADAGAGAELDVALSVKPDGFAAEELELEPAEIEELGGGWTRQTLAFSVSSDAPAQAIAQVGLVLGVAASDPAQPTPLSITLGELSLLPAPPEAPTTLSRLLWADFAAAPADTDFAGVLTWADALALPPAALPAQLPGPESTAPLWRGAQPRAADALAYVNVYALPLARAAEGARAARFVGSSGAEGAGGRMRVSWAGLRGAGVGEGGEGEGEEVRFYVQGVDEGGRVWGWERGVYVDAVLA